MNATRPMPFRQATSDRAMSGPARLCNVVSMTVGDSDSAQGLTAFMRAQAEVIDAGFRDLGDDPGPEVVHDVRVATRRLRTALRSFSSLVDLDDEARTEVEEDLRWLASLLSGIRDADILQQNLDERLDALPDELVMGPVREEISTTLGDERRAALAELAAEQDSPRYHQIRETVHCWRLTPPLTDDAAQQIEVQGREILARRRRRARQRLATASVDPSQTHEARKAVKRLRYTADVLAPVIPEARKLAKRAKRLQRRLGSHQDAVVEVEFLRAQARTFGPRAGSNGFVYGVLLADAERRATEVQDAVLRL
jgi:CHAD domain-containing protein